MYWKWKYKFYFTDTFYLSNQSKLSSDHCNIHNTRPIIHPLAQTLWMLCYKEEKTLPAYHTCHWLLTISGPKVPGKCKVYLILATKNLFLFIQYFYVYLNLRSANVIPHRPFLHIERRSWIVQFISRAANTAATLTVTSNKSLIVFHWSIHFVPLVTFH